MHVYTGADTLGQPEALAFLEYFGITADPREDLEGFLLSLRQIDPRYNDPEGRGRYLVRYELEADHREWDEKAIAVIMAAAKAFDMLLPETRLVGHHDVVVVMGAARLANDVRAFAAAEDLASGKATANHVVAAGSSRLLRDDEKLIVEKIAPGAFDEAGLCQAAAEAVNRKYPSIHFEWMRVDNEKAGNEDVLNAAINRYRGLQNECQRWTLKSVAAYTTEIYLRALMHDLRRVALTQRIPNTFAAGTDSPQSTKDARTPAVYMAEDVRTLKAAGLAAHAGV
jgi:hypothetical protein